jgi:hypothetical protein
MKFHTRSPFVMPGFDPASIKIVGFFLFYATVTGSVTPG